jgi:Endonuclease/Exonuclease/phosphatase family
VAHGRHSRYARSMTRLGTWNLENLARPGGPAGAPDDQSAYEEKLNTLAATITELAPDVLAIQEVLDSDALDDLIDLLDGSWQTALADPDGRGIRVGLLSRTALSDVEQIRDFPDGLLPFRSTMTAAPSASSAGQACGPGSAPAAGRSRSSRST